LKIHFKILLPVIYAIVQVLLIGACVLSIGHGQVCEYIYWPMKPVYYLIPKVYIAGLILGFVGGAAQYFMLGLAIDALFSRGKRSED
jgi:hypothetical protein